MGRRRGFIVTALILVVLGVVALGFAFANRAEAPRALPELLISVESPQKNSPIDSPVLVRGFVRSGWTAFEGQVGNVSVLDEDGTELGVGILAATSDWLNSPVSFQVSVPFREPKGKTGKLLFESENPSGDLTRVQTFELPISFRKI